MKILVDAQLPQRLAQWLRAHNCDEVHTLELPLANRTPDDKVIEMADLQGRFVVTKDADFVRAYLLQGRPSKLCLITTGNIRNEALMNLIAANWTMIHSALTSARFIELSSTGLIIHE